MEIARYAAEKFIQFILTMLVLTLLVFFVSRLAPGDPLKAYYGEALERMSIEQQEAARERLGLSEGMAAQFTGWAKAALQGDFGLSLKYKQDAAQVVLKVYQNTAALILTCFVLIFVLGIVLALLCVEYEGRLPDKVVRKIGVATNSIPEFLVALALMLLFCVTLRVLPSSGAYDAGSAARLGSRVVHLILPVSAIVISHLWYCAYLMRNKLSDEVRKEYVLLYRVKGLSKARIYRHCLKNIMPASISMMAVFLPHLLGGAYVVEMVFSYPGLGSLGFESARYSDYNMLMLICLITGSLVILANMAAQIVSEKIDPRMKPEGRGGGQ